MDTSRSTESLHAILKKELKLIIEESGGTNDIDNSKPKSKTSKVKSAHERQRTGKQTEFDGASNFQMFDSMRGLSPLADMNIDEFDYGMNDRNDAFQYKKSCVNASQKIKQSRRKAHSPHTLQNLKAEAEHWLPEDKFAAFCNSSESVYFDRRKSTYNKEKIHETRTDNVAYKRDAAVKPQTHKDCTTDKRTPDRATNFGELQKTERDLNHKSKREYTSKIEQKNVAKESGHTKHEGACMPENRKQNTPTSFVEAQQIKGEKRHSSLNSAKNKLQKEHLPLPKIEQKNAAIGSAKITHEPDCLPQNHNGVKQKEDKSMEALEANCEAAKSQEDLPSSEQEQKNYVTKVCVSMPQKDVMQNIAGNFVEAKQAAAKKKLSNEDNPAVANLEQPKAAKGSDRSKKRKDKKKEEDAEDQFIPMYDAKYIRDSMARIHAELVGNPANKSAPLDNLGNMELERDFGKLQRNLDETYNLFKSVGEQFESLNFGNLNTHIQDMHLHEKHSESIGELKLLFEKSFQENRLRNLTREMKDNLQKHPGEFGDIPEISAAFKACNQLQSGIMRLHQQDSDLSEMKKRVYHATDASYNRIEEIRKAMKKQKAQQEAENE